jgi:hypothetical protein
MSLSSDSNHSDLPFRFPDTTRESQSRSSLLFCWTVCRGSGITLAFLVVEPAINVGSRSYSKYQRTCVSVIKLSSRWRGVSLFRGAMVRKWHLQDQSTPIYRYPYAITGFTSLASQLINLLPLGRHLRMVDECRAISAGA